MTFVNYLLEAKSSGKIGNNLLYKTKTEKQGSGTTEITKFYCYNDLACSVTLDGQGGGGFEMEDEMAMSELMLNLKEV